MAENDSDAKPTEDTSDQKPPQAQPREGTAPSDAKGFAKSPVPTGDLVIPALDSE